MSPSAAIAIALVPFGQLILRVIVRALALLVRPLIPERWRGPLYRKR